MKFGTILCFVFCLLLTKGAYASESNDRLLSPWQKWLGSLFVTSEPSKIRKQTFIPTAKTGGGQGDPQVNIQKLSSPTMSTGGGQGDP